ncbi:MAG: SWIM zinc finger domain-containing protein, partial [Dehalococcoidia bacterium]
MSELTETTVRQYATPESFRRGRDYYEQGAVLSLARRGDQLLAEVEGSQYEPYQVQVTLDAGDVAEAICTCPYDWGGYCKHIVATLLAYIHEPDQVEERPTLESLLDGLGADQLREILLSLIERRPGLDDVVEAQVLALQSPSEGELAPRQRRTPLDPAPFRRQVRDILHSLDHMRASEAYWHVGGVVDGVRRVLDQARAYVEANDGRNALVILEAITEEYVAGWVYLDDSDGEAGGFFGDLGEVWIEAILITALTPEEREQWAERLARWQGEVDDYGIDAVFSAAEAAARQGWDYLPLQRVLQGEITDKGAWEDEAPPYADDLAVARLNVLDRQGRH